jgi:hypothetical protein
MHHHARRIEELGHAQAVAAAAGADRRVEREQPRFQFRQRVVAHRALNFDENSSSAGAAGLPMEAPPARVHVHGDDAHQPSPSACGLEGFGEALLDVLARAEAVDHRFDGVLARSAERRTASSSYSVPSTRARTSPARALHRTPAGARPCARAPPAPAACSASQDQRQRAVDHLADGLRFQRRSRGRGSAACRRARTAGAGSRGSR